MEREANSSVNCNMREWKNIKIHGTEYIVSTFTTKSFWKISLTNLVDIWTETITKDIALARCQLLNVLLDLDSFDITKPLDEMLSDIPKHATDKSLHNINLEIGVEGIAFRFNINLTKGNPEQLWNEITRPLCESATELQRRHEILIDLIKRKDEEISEYKLSGAELTRKNIETAPYNEDIFRRNVGVDTSNADDCVKTFISMFKLHELENHEYEPNNDARHLSRESGDQNPIDPNVRIKLENPETIENHETTATGNNNEVDEMQHRMKTETSMETPSTSENESVASRSTDVGQNGTTSAKLSMKKVKTGLPSEKNKHKHSIVKTIGVPLVQTVQTKRPKRVNRTRNIYDLIK